jgi:hypothetical protein
MRKSSLSSAPVIGHREAVALLIGGGLALLFGVIFALEGAWALTQEYQFLTNSTSGVAEIIGKERSGQSSFFVDCRLLVGIPNKAVYEKRIAVYSGLWQNLRKGQALNVQYLRSDPANMRLPGSIGNVWDSFLHLVIGLFLVIIGIAVLIVAIRFLVREAGSQPQSTDRPEGTEP